MATTRIIPMHVSQDKTIADCLTDRIGYSNNSDKTQDGELISAYQCDHKTADAESPFSKQQYRPAPAGSSRATSSPIRCASPSSPARSRWRRQNACAMSSPRTFSRAGTPFLWPPTIPAAAVSLF